MDTRKQNLLNALRDWINQRPGLDPRNYDRASYRSESRKITQDRSDAMEILGVVALRPYVTADHILHAAAHAFSGRLSIRETAPAQFELDYCTGQYWPTEYRKAAAAVLANAYGGAYWGVYCCGPDKDAGHMRQYFRNEFGPAIQGRWFS